jgi:hypothetical protein
MEFLARVGVAETKAEADVWHSFLWAEGIPSLVKNRNPLDYLQAVIPFSRYDYEVWVPQSAAQRARKVLAASLRPRRLRPMKPLTKQLALLWFALGPGQWLIAAIAFPVTFVASVFA